MAYHSEIPLDGGFSWTGLPPLNCAYSNFDPMKIVLSWPKAEMPIFRNYAYFSVTSLVLKDVNVRGGNVIKPSHQKYVYANHSQDGAMHARWLENAKYCFYRKVHNFSNGAWSLCLELPISVSSGFHLLGKDWPFGFRLWCLTVSLLLSHWYLGSGVVLDCINSWSLHPYLLRKGENVFL